ncbi:hypothetical protein [Dactylosporangium sp. CS-033363]|uniref:hypothetical protein n=1 Tax=Dactylosporangium sp. CS-033363 TaxID=3239935 RepID=UPI003D949656
MSEPVLIADVGAATTKAVVVHSGQVAPVVEPVTGSPIWPTALHAGMCVGTLALRRRRADPRGHTGWDETGGNAVLVQHMLAALREAAGANHGEIARLVLLADHVAPGVMLEAAERAGFAEVELLQRAAALAAEPSKPGAADLVLDFGARALVVTLVRAGVDGPMPFPPDVEPGAGGWAITAALAELVRAGDALATDIDLADTVQRMQQTLSVADRAVDTVVALGPVLEIGREQLPAALGPIADRAVGTVRALLREWAGDVDRVVLTGGASRSPYLRQVLAEGLPGLHVVRTGEPELDAVRGAAKLVRDAPQRRAAPSPENGHTPLRWDAAGARLLRWLVEPGGSFAARAELAVVRTADGALLRLRAPDRAGVLAARHAGAGDLLTDGGWVATVRPSSRAVGFTILHDIPCGTAEAVAFSPAGLLAVGMPGAVAVMEIDGTGGWTREDCGEMYAVAFAGEQRLWAGGDDPEILGYDVGTGRSGPGPFAEDSVLDLAADPDGRWLAVATAGATTLYRVGDMRSAWSRTDTGGAVACSPDGAWIATPHGTGLVLVDFEHGLTQRTPIATGLVAEADKRLAFSRDGERLAACDTAGNVVCCRPRGYPQVWAVTEPGVVWGLAFTPGGDRLVVGGARIAVLDAADGSVLAQYEPPRQVTALALAPDGVTLALGTEFGVTVMRMGETG